MGFERFAGVMETPAVPYVIARRPLCVDDVVVEVEVPPADNSTGSIDTVIPIEKGKRRHCRKFIRAVRGGHVACFVHHIDSDRIKARQRLSARATVWVEQYSDGREFLAIHLIESRKPPTHTWKVFSTAEIPARYDQFRSLRFSAVPPLLGWVLFVPHVPVQTV